MKQEHFAVFERCLNRIDEKVDRVFDYSEKHHYIVDVFNGKHLLTTYESDSRNRIPVSKEKVETTTGLPYNSLLYVLSLSQTIAQDAITRHDPMARKENIKEKLPIVLLASAIISAQLKSNHQKGEKLQSININDVSEKLFDILYDYNEAAKKTIGNKPIILNNETTKFIKRVMKEKTFYVTLNHELEKEGLEIDTYQMVGESKNPVIEISASNQRQQKTTQKRQ